MSLINYKINLPLLEYKDGLNTTFKNEKTFVQDPVRKKWILLQPEEFVRQLLIRYLIEKSDFHRNNIQVEKTIQINQLVRRFDIVIYDKSIKPFILIECKAPNVKIDQSTFDQIAIYNLQIQAPFLLVSNGIESYCAKMNHQAKRYDFQNYLPLSFE